MDYDFTDRTELCAGCPCAGRPYVPARGKADTRYFCVGAAPGPQEEVRRKAFVGKAGSMVADLLADLGLDPVFTNVLKRRPLGERPTKVECFRCGLHLIEELKFHEATVVLTLGQTPFRFLYGMDDLSVRDVHGLPMPMSRFGMDFIVVPAYDPGYVLRNGGLDSRIGEQWLLDLDDYRDRVEKYG